MRYFARTEFDVSEVKRAGAAKVEVAEFDGYASTFGNEDVVGDVIQRGAFKGSLKRSLPLLWQHDMSSPIGSITKMSEDNDGLFITGEINLGTANGRDAYSLMAAGHIDTMSIGFRIPRGGYKIRDGGGRTISKIDLVEISLVTIPANPKAVVTSVKEIDPALAAEILHRELGVSVQDAENVIKTGVTATAGGISDGMADLNAALEDARATIANIKRSIRND